MTKWVTIIILVAFASFYLIKFRIINNENKKLGLNPKLFGIDIFRIIFYLTAILLTLWIVLEIYRM